MSYTPNGIYFEELADSPEIGIGTEMVGAVRQFICNWENWQEFAYELIGFWRIIGLATIFTPPISFPGVPLMIVSDVKIKPYRGQCPTPNQYVDIGGDTNVYRMAHLSVTYKTIPFGKDNENNPSVPDGTYLTYEDDIGAEIQTVSGRQFFWNGDLTKKLPADMQPGILIPTGNYRLNWERVVAPPWSAIRACRGKVNSTTFCGSPPGTVMFLGAQDQRQFQFDPSSDQGFWKMRYQFAEDIKYLSNGTTPAGWNYLRSDTAIDGESWVTVKDRAGRPMYDKADLNSLFQFEIQLPTS